MAIVIGNEVALVNNGSAAEPLSLRGNILFGVVIAGTDPWDVLWENGKIAEDVPGAVLDKISSSIVDAKKYQWSDLNPAYAGFVVRAYARQTDGSGDITPYVMLRAEDGVNYEVLQSLLEAVPG